MIWIICRHSLSLNLCMEPQYLLVKISSFLFTCLMKQWIHACTHTHTHTHMHTRTHAHTHTHTRTHFLTYCYNLWPQEKGAWALENGKKQDKKQIIIRTIWADGTIEEECFKGRSYTFICISPKFMWWSFNNLILQNVTVFGNSLWKYN